MSKICTTIEQSKKLVELGLNPESADMCWFDGELLSETEFPPYHYDIDRMETHKAAGRDVSPAWSLSALLEIIKKLVGYSLQSLDTPNTVFMSCELGDKPYTVETNNYDNPVDACVAMIESLHELNLT